MLSYTNIEDILQPYRNVDIAIDADGNVENEQISKHVDSIIEKLKSNITTYNFDIFKEKSASDIVQLSGDLFTSSGFFFFGLITDFHNYLVNYYYEDNSYFKCVSHLHNSSITLFQEIITLSCSLGKKGVISRFRTLYENYIIMRFIIMVPNTADVLIDHAEFSRLRISSMIDPGMVHEFESIKDKLKEKYGEVFCNSDYGWAYSSFKNSKKISLLDLAKYIGILDYSSFYKISCEYVHTSSLSILYSGLDKTISDLFIVTSIELFINHFIHYLKIFKINKAEEVIIMSIVYGLRKDLLGA